MADIAYTDLTFTLIRKDMARKERMNKWTIALASSSLTYPANGIPLGASVKGAIRRLGLDREADVELLEVPQDGYVYKFDRTNMTIRIYQTAGFTPSGTAAAQVFTGSALGTHVHDLKVMGGATFDTDAGVGTLASGGPKLTKTAAGDVTVAGADSATKGGVMAVTGGTPAGTNATSAVTGVAVAAAVLVELGNVAVAAKTFRVRATGI